MKLWTVIRREWSEWRLLPVAALILGIAAWAAPFFPTFDRLDPSEVRQATALMVFLLLGIGSIAFLGASLARDVVSGKLSFYLTRPLHAPTLWTGKMLGAGSLLLCIWGLALLPTFLTEWEELRFPRVLDDAVPLSALEESLVGEATVGLPEALPWFLQFLRLGLVALTALMLVHWLYLSVRSRSPWLLLDVAGLAVVGLALWRQWDALVSQQAFGGLVWIERGWVLLLPLALWVAGRQQIEHGRLDPRRSHRIFSWTLWPCLAFAVLVGGLFTRHILKGDVDDLAVVYGASVSPNGDTLVAGGPLEGRSGRRAAFLIDSAGEGLPVGGLFPSVHLWRWSADGSDVIWSKCRRLSPLDCELWTRDLQSKTPPRGTDIAVTDPTAVVALSADGSRVAVGDRRGVEVYALDTGRLLFAKETPHVSDLYFVGLDDLRVHHFPEGNELRLLIRRVDLAKGSSQITGELPDNTTREGTGVRSPDGRRLLFNSLFPTRYEIRDSLTGEVLTDFSSYLDTGFDSGLMDGRFLPDGRLALVFLRRNSGGSTHADHRILVLEEDGSVFARASLAGARRVGIVPSLDGGTITLAVTRDLPRADPRLAAAGLDPLPETSTYFLHPGEDRLERVGAGFVPVGPGRHDLPSRAAIFLAGKDAFFTFDGGWEEGSIRILVPPRPRGGELEGYPFLF